MTRPRLLFVILLALAVSLNIPGVAFAQGSGSSQVPAGQNYAPVQQGEINQSAPANPPAGTNQSQPAQSNRQSPQPKGGVAVVIGVDQPDNCLRIRSGPGGSYEVIGCAEMGQQLQITGVWTSNDWAQLADNGWVYGPQIQTDLRPPPTAYSEPQNYVTVEEDYPVYYDTYPDDYLPYYGYTNYWYGGVPIFLYNVNVWRRFHPWWWHRNRHDGHKVWNRDGSFRQNVRTGTNRTFGTNRSGAFSPNVNRFNTNTLRPGSSGAGRSGFSNATRSSGLSATGTGSANTLRSRSSNATRSGASSFLPSGSSSATRTLRSFSGTNRIGTGSSRVRQFSSPRSGGFSSGRASSFSMPRSSGFSGGRASGFSMPRSSGFSAIRSGGGGGGGFRFGGSGGLRR